MGTRLPERPDGNPSMFCWGPGKAFGDITTPRYIYAQLSGLQPGDGWRDDKEQLLLTRHRLVQKINPLQWGIFDGYFTWLVDFDETFTFVDVRSSSPILLVIIRQIDIPCQTTIESSITAPQFVYAFDGQIDIEV